MNVLEKVVRDRRAFDPSNLNDIEEFRYFLINHKWKNGCPFYLDWPYLTIPDMIKDMIIKHTLRLE